MATVVVQILLMIGRLDVDGSAQSTLLDVNIDIQEGDMGLGGVPEVYRKTLKGRNQTNMEGGQSGTYLRLTRASSGPRVSVAKTIEMKTKRKWIFRPKHRGLPQQ